MSLLLSFVIADGTLAARPAASVDGRLYFATDVSRVYRDNGLTWDDVTPTLVFVSEVVAFTGTSGAFAHTPVNLIGLFKNGQRLTRLGIAPDFSNAGTAITLTIAAISGDFYEAIYFY